jgi:hypothetical protein
MAFETTIEYKPSAFDTPAKIENAYCRIAYVAGDKRGMTIRVNCFKNQSVADQDPPAHVVSVSFTPDMSDGAANFIAQAYDHLKTLPEFVNAKDC